MIISWDSVIKVVNEKRICGVLKSAIDAHGPITLANRSSASKRVTHQLRAELKNESIRSSLPYNKARLLQHASFSGI